MTIPDFSVKRPIATKMIYLVMLVIGVYSLAHLPVNLLPDLNYPHLEIMTVYPGVGAEGVENLVTQRLVDALQGQEGLQELQGISRKGVSLIRMKYRWGTDMDYALLFLRQALDEAAWSLPPEASRPVILKTDPSQKPVMGYALLGDNLPGLSELAQNVFKKRLEEVQGVARAEVLGEYKRVVKISIEPEALVQHGISYEDVAAAIEQNNLSFFGGAVQRGNQKYTIHISGNIESIEDLGKVGIPQGNNIIPLSRIAQIDFDYENSYSCSFYDNREAIGLMIYKEYRANILQTADKLHDAFLELQEEFPDYEYIELFDEAGFVRASILNLGQSLLIGAALAFIVLLLFIRKFWKTVCVFINIPVSIILILFIMFIMKIDINIISLAGLALGCGMLVDNSIIVFENIHRTGQLSRKGIAHGTNQVAKAITASTLTNICVFLPLLYISGLPGELLKALALTASASLLVSLLTALSLFPAVLASGKKIKSVQHLPVSETRSPTKKIYAYYETLLRLFIKNPKKVLITGAMLSILILVSAHWLPTESFPPTPSHLYELYLETPSDFSFESTVGAVKRLAGEITGEISPGVFANIGLRTGQYRREGAVNSAVLTINFPQGGSLRDTLLIKTSLNSQSFQFYQLNKKGNVLEQLGESQKFTHQITLKASHRETLTLPGQELFRYLYNRGYQILPPVGLAEDQLTCRVSFKKNMLTKYRLTEGELLAFLHTELQGRNIGTLDQVSQSFDINLATHPRQNTSMKDLREALYPHNNTLIPMDQLIRLELVPTLTVITSEDGIPALSLMLNIPQRQEGKLRDDLECFKATAGLPAGLDINILSTREKARELAKPLLFAFLLSLLLVYAVLSVEYESLRLPLLILTGVFFALTGAVVMMHLTGTTLNTIAAIGFIVLAGLAVNDAILKVDFYQKWRLKGSAPLRTVIEVGKIRLRPILMTSFTTIFALLPLLFSRGENSALWKPMAVVIIGGLFSSTILTLFILPLLYLAFQSRSER